MERPSTASLERDAGRSNLRRPSVLSSLGGCPASCPDTYRLTHDHRHVRNWARLEIRLLISLRNNFFRLWANFLRACLQIGFHRTPRDVRKTPREAKHEQPLRNFREKRELVNACAAAVSRIAR